MGRTTSHPEPPTQVAGAWSKLGKGPSPDLEARVFYAFVNAPENADRLSNVDLTHLSMIKKKDGWLVMLKGERPRMTVVAFLHGPTYREALVAAVTCLDSGHVPWQESKPPPWETA